LKQNFYINKVFNSLIDENCNSVIIAFVVALVVGLVVGCYWGVATQQSLISTLKAELDKTTAELRGLRTEVEKLVASKPQLPTPKPVTVTARTTALIIVDMQNDFCKPNGSLFVGPSVTASIPHIKALLDRARKAGVHVIYTQDWHPADDPEFKIWPMHCVQGTWGAEVIDELKPMPGDYVVKKTTYDAFFARKTDVSLEDLLKDLNVDTVIVTGTVSNICVMHVVAGASLRGFKVVVPIDCISALNDYGQELAIFQMSFLYRAEITNSTLITFT
jgi:nicotinamidase-related amidase